MMIMIKQVPNSSPNAEGVWVARQISAKFSELCGNFERFTELNKLVEPGYHAVAYDNLKGGALIVTKESLE
jgi:hypothetical protein